MIKLLNAGFTRLRKNKLFWLLTVFSIGLALFVIYAQYNQMTKYSSEINLEYIICSYSTMIGIVIAIFTSLFLGVEYSDGAIRNKISIGHKRMNIYLSNLIIVFLTSLFSYLLFLIVTIIIGIPLFGWIKIPISELLMNLFSIFMIILSYSSIFTFIAMMISNKTITAIVSIMLSFGMMMYVLSALNMLQQKETAERYVMEMDNGEVMTETVKNPYYLTGTKRNLVQLSVDIIPTGQAYQISSFDIMNINIFPIYSLGIFVVFTGLGLALFRRKELK